MSRGAPAFYTYALRPEMIHLCKEEKTVKRKTGKDNGPYHNLTKEGLVQKIKGCYREKTAKIAPYALDIDYIH